jgi:hypothetical protein
MKINGFHFLVRDLDSAGVFQELKDVSYFKKARAADGTVVWPHEQDICPDTLYLDSLKTIPSVSR